MKHALSVPTTGPTLLNTAATTQAVSKLQQILNQRGAKLKQDGLYGPKTASAWKAAAKSKGLPDTIARVNSKTAKVVARTYDSLSIP
jgi:peptidoglycan hydrolase-like protein with peptidoglycan-binding domain